MKSVKKEKRQAKCRYIVFCFIILGALQDLFSRIFKNVFVQFANVAFNTDFVTPTVLVVLGTL